MSTLLDIFTSLQNCLFCFPSTPQLRISGHNYRMLRLLGEGGFSYVYLVQSISDPSKLYALKKIRCPFGQESVSQALKEVEAYSLFKGCEGGEFIIEAVGHEVRDEGGKGGVSGIGNEGEGRAGNKTVYILLPYYQKGNLQDAINANLVNHTRFGEKHLMEIMLGVCKGLRALHHYRIGNSRTESKAKAIRKQAQSEDADAARKSSAKSKGKQPQRQNQMTADQTHQNDLETEQEQPFLEDSNTNSVLGPQTGHSTGSPLSYSHRDIKPANIMLDDRGDPILMDLGSLAPSPTPITSRSLALLVQDTAGEHSTMPYRAPELFDVKTGSTIDTKVDIWSLGCTMFACLVGKSPFEMRSEETGGSLSICVLGGDWRWPDQGNNNKGKGRINTPINATTGAAGANGSAGNGGNERIYPSEGVREIVSRCLRVEASERPDVDQLEAMIEEVLSTLPEDGDGDV